MMVRSHAVVVVATALLLALSLPQLVVGQDGAGEDNEAYAESEDECLSGGVDGDSVKRMTEWDTDRAFETLENEKRCEETLRIQLVEANIGKHGPPSENVIKRIMCASECDLFIRNINELIRESRCTCEKLDVHFPYDKLPSGNFQLGPGPYVHRKLPSSWCERNPMFYLYQLTGMLAVSNDHVFVGDEEGDNDPPDEAKPPHIMDLQSAPCKTAACEGELIYAKVAYHWYRIAMYNMPNVDKDAAFDKYCSSIECQWNAYYYKYCRCDVSMQNGVGELWCGWSGSPRSSGDFKGASLGAATFAAVAGALRWR